MAQFAYATYSIGYDDFSEPRSVFGRHHQMGAMSGRQALENVMNSPAFKQWEDDLRNRGRKTTDFRKHRQE